jgi:hypothetical protein
LRVAELNPLLRRLGDLFPLPWAVVESAFLAIAAANWDSAVAAIEAAIELNHRVGYPHWKAWYVAHLGWLARLRGQQEEAVALGRQALDLTEQHAHSWWEAAACAGWAGPCCWPHDRTAAIGVFERGMAARAPVGTGGSICSAAPLLWPRHRLAGRA